VEAQFLWTISTHYLNLPGFKVLDLHVAKVVILYIKSIGFYRTLIYLKIVLPKRIKNANEKLQFKVQ
jgi:hypothetical protein